MRINRILVRFVEDGVWVPWDCMTEYEYDAGEEFPVLKEKLPEKTLWIRFDQSRVDEVLNAEIGGEVE